jgi:poly(A) polymerase
MAKFPGFGFAILELHRLGLLQVIFPDLKDIPRYEIERRVETFKAFPKGSPVILYLMDLFGETSLEELLELCQYLKTSGQESKLLEFAFKGKELFLQEETAPHAIEIVEWANFYAHRLFEVCFDVLAARYSEDRRGQLIERHQQRRERLLPHVERIAMKKPLVTAAILKDHGIVPGKLMGDLLKQAEVISIQHDLHDEMIVVEHLKKLPLWPK